MENQIKVVFEEILTSSKDLYSSTNSLSEQLKEEFLKKSKEKINHIHELLDEKKKRLIELAIESHRKSIITEINEEKYEKYLKKQTKKRDENEKDEKDNEMKIIKKEIESINDKTDRFIYKINESYTIIDKINNDKIRIKDNVFEVPLISKLEYSLKNKNLFELKWDEEKGKKNNFSIEESDSSQLNVNSNSCYNYFFTSPELSDESLLIKFETNIQKTDSYFYFGVTGASNVFDSNCLCCSPSLVTYIKSTGEIKEKGTTVRAEALLNYTSIEGEFNIISLRIDCNTKEIYFSVNDNEEIGPFSLPDDDKYIIVSGSCNSATGYIKIISSENI